MPNKMPRYLRPNAVMQYPRSAERDYYRVLRAVVRALRKYTNELLPSIKPSLKQDADSEDLMERLLEMLNADMTLEAALQEIEKLIGTVDNVVRANINLAFKNSLSVDVFMHNSSLLNRVT